MWLANLMANVSLSIWYQLHDGLQAGQTPGSDQSHFGLVRAAAHTYPERKDDSRYWQPKRGYFAAVAFTHILRGRELSSPASRPVIVATAASAKSRNTTFALSFQFPAPSSTLGSTISSSAGAGVRPPVAPALNLSAAQVLVAWCADMRLLPCPLTLRSPPGQVAWTTASCFDRVDFVGEELDRVCAEGDGNLRMYVDNAPQYLTLAATDQ